MSLQILNDNEHMMSYIESGAFANKEMQQMSKMYNTISRISDRVADSIGKTNERKVLQGS
jgi:hypothetical protein